MTDDQRDPDKDKGWYQKYVVNRLHDPTGKHTNCQMWVLDLNHDPFSIPAMLAYAEACKDLYGPLSRDIYARLRTMRERNLFAWAGNPENGPILEMLDEVLSIEEGNPC